MINDFPCLRNNCRMKLWWWDSIRFFVVWTSASRSVNYFEPCLCPFKSIERLKQYCQFVPFIKCFNQQWHGPTLILNQQLWWGPLSKQGIFSDVFLLTELLDPLTSACVCWKWSSGAWPRLRRGPGSCPGWGWPPPGTWRASPGPPPHSAPAASSPRASGWWSSREDPRVQTRVPRAQAET